MIEILTQIANAQAQLASLQLALIAEQETPASLEKAARMARSLEDTSNGMVKHLQTWADDMRHDLAADELITSLPLEEHEG